MRRRTYLAVAASTAVGLAGCTGAEPTDSSSGADDGNESDSPTDDASNGLPETAGTSDDFADLESWEVYGGDLSADPGRSLVGSQSARLETPTSEGGTRLTTTFDEPRDFSEVVPGVAVAADDYVLPWIRLVDGDGDSIVYRRGVSGDLPLMRYNFGVDEFDGSFDDTRVSEVHLQVWTGEDQRRTIWFDDLHFTPRPETGKVMIQFDDGHDTDYTEALPILEEYGYPAVTFVNPGSIDHGPTRLTTDQLYELHDAGWSVANHTVTHAELPELDAEEQEAEIREGKEWLVEHGFEDGAEYFAYPYGQFDETTIELVDEYHSIGFAGGLPVQGYTTNTKLTSRIGEPTVERVETELERTAEMRGITKLFYHRLEDDDLEAFETLVETLYEYESAGELEVILPGDLEREYLF